MSMRDGLDASQTELKVDIAGTELWLDVNGVAFEPNTQTLIVADLHFEKGSAFARSGQMLPPYDTRATLNRLQSVIERLKPHSVIALGDSFHDFGAEGRMHERDHDHLKTLVSGVGRWVWIAGNHDPHPPKGLAGETKAVFALETLTLRHEPEPPGALGEVAGHLHPCAKVKVRGKSLRRRCFASDGTRLILPAFGAFTGGLNVCDRAFLDVFGHRPDVFLMGDRQLFPIGSRKLRDD